MRNLNKLKGAPTKFNNVSIKHDMTPEERSKERQLHLKTKELNNKIQSDDSQNGFCSERTHMGQKNSESDKTKKINESSNSKQLKVWYSNADVLTTDKLIN